MKQFLRQPNPLHVRVLSVVLSSDEEESCDVPQRCSPLAHTLLTVEDAVTQRQSQQDALAKEQETSDLQDMQVSDLTQTDQECSCVTT